MPSRRPRTPSPARRGLQRHTLQFDARFGRSAVPRLWRGHDSRGRGRLGPGHTPRSPDGGMFTVHWSLETTVRPGAVNLDFRRQGSRLTKPAVRTQEDRTQNIGSIVLVEGLRCPRARPAASTLPFLGSGHLPSNGSSRSMDSQSQQPRLPYSIRTYAKEFQDSPRPTCGGLEVT